MGVNSIIAELFGHGADVSVLVFGLFPLVQGHVARHFMRVYLFGVVKERVLHRQSNLIRRGITAHSRHSPNLTPLGPNPTSSTAAAAAAAELIMPEPESSRDDVSEVEALRPTPKHPNVLPVFMTPSLSNYE